MVVELFHRSTQLASGLGAAADRQIADLRCRGAEARDHSSEPSGLWRKRKQAMEYQLCFENAINRLKSEERYRAFANLERDANGLVLLARRAPHRQRRDQPGVNASEAALPCRSDAG